jgi:translation initiation factor IF-3
MSHSELGADVLKQFAEGLSDVGQVEEDARMEGRNMTMVLVPKRG